MKAKIKKKEKFNKTENNEKTMKYTVLLRISKNI